VILPLIEGRAEGWPLWTWLSFGTSAVLFAAFGTAQRRRARTGRSPLVDMSLFRQRAFAFGLLAQLVFWMGQASFFLVLALYLQQGRHLTALQAGLIFVVVGAGYLAPAPDQRMTRPSGAQRGCIAEAERGRFEHDPVPTPEQVPPIARPGGRLPVVRPGALRAAWLLLATTSHEDRIPGELMIDIQAQELVDRYVAVWNEPEPELRGKAIRELWAHDGTHILQPPEEIRTVAARLGFTSTVLEAHGHEALEARVARAYEDFVAGGNSPSGRAATPTGSGRSSSSTGR
jgi:hypothetical protein